MTTTTRTPIVWTSTTQRPHAVVIPHGLGTSASDAGITLDDALSHLTGILGHPITVARREWNALAAGWKYHLDETREWAIMVYPADMQYRARWSRKGQRGGASYLIPADANLIYRPVIMTTTTIRTLQDAIDRSRSHTEITAVVYEGDDTDLLIALDGLYDGEVDSARENDGTIDVWGWTLDMAQGEMDWRLRVTLV